MTYTDAFLLATDAAFQGRCRMAFCQLCGQVATEDAAALALPAGARVDAANLHGRRTQLAYACATAQDDYIACFARQMALQPGITKVSTDADLLTAAATVFTQMALRGS
jgi:hypothetical protein